jgi:hypothetical protein
MSVGPAKPERTHAGEALVLPSRQGRRLSRYGEVQSREVNVWIGALEMKGPRRLVMLQSKHRLEHPRQARRGLEVADVGLYRADWQRFLPDAPKDRPERGCLDRIAGLRPGGVRST